MKDASTDTGSARPVMTVERQELRNRNTTSTVSSAPSTSASSTLLTERRDARAGVADDAEGHALPAASPAARRPGRESPRRPASVL